MIKKSYTGAIKFSVNYIEDEFRLKKAIENFRQSLIGSKFFYDSITIQIEDIGIKGHKEEPKLLLEEK